MVLSWVFAVFCKFIYFIGSPQFIDILLTGLLQISVDNFGVSSELTWIKKKCLFNVMF